MATLLLAAAGAALGGGMGGTVAGLSMAVLGKAVGATVGSIIDQRLMGLGSETVEAGKVDRFRVMGSSEGAALPRVFGRVRVAGQLIWSSRFLERVSTESVGGKGGGGGGQKVEQYSYSVSVAVALCEGEVLRVGRIWADGQVLDQKGVTFRLHRGDEGQLPDPLIAAIEGADAAPAYRGTAYVVIEDLELAPYGNRIPQFNFEVFRRAEPGAGVARSPALDVRGVALVPGTGEYSLATEKVRFKRGKGNSVILNIHNDRGLPDLVVSLDQLEAELPASRAVSLVVSWFGDDLRCGRCLLQPKVEQNGEDGEEIAWRVSGRVRDNAVVVSRLDGRPMFGGTPADRDRDPGDPGDARPRAGGDVLSVHPDGHPGGQRAGRSVDGCGGPAAGAVAGADHAGRGARAAGVGGQDRGGGVGGGGVLRDASAGDFDPRGIRWGITGRSEWSLSAVHPALCASVRAGGGRGCLLHRLGDAVADAGARTGRPAIRRCASCRHWPRRCGRCWGRARRSAMRRTGRSISDTSRRTGRATCSIISIRSGRMPTSISSASTTTCRFRTGATGRSMRMPPPGRSMTSAIWPAISRAARGSTGTMPDAAGREAQVADADHRWRLWRGLGPSLQGYRVLVVEPAS